MNLNYDYTPYCSYCGCNPCQCDCCCIGITGATGASGNSIQCTCVQQMRNLLNQIIQLYPTNTVIVYMESDDNSNGRPGSLIPTSVNMAGLFQLTDNQGVPQEAVSICRIVAVTVTNAVYNPAITYLPAPILPAEECSADCQAAIRTYMPVGTTGVNIRTGGQAVAQGTIIRNEYGVLVVVGPNNSDPTFVSTCKAEILNK